MPLPPTLPRAPRCPTCGAAVHWRNNPHRPFCSIACRLIDLGGWLDERYRIGGEAIANDPAPEDRMTRGNG